MTRLITDPVAALIEITKGSRNKYEYDERRGALRLDRVLHSPLHYPTDYGFILETRAEDGDHLDALVFTHEATFPGCVVDVRPIGVLDMIDEKGRDQKVLAVPVGDPRFAGIRDLPDVEGHWLREIQHFFEIYKTLEEKPTEILGWLPAPDAVSLIARSRRPMRQRVSSGAPWEPRMGYSRAVRTGRRVIVSGTASDGGDGVPVASVAYEQARHILQIIGRALAEAGADFADVVRTRVYVTDISQWEEVARAHEEIFGEIRPATTMVEVSRLIRPDMLVEIEAEAVIG